MDIIRFYQLVGEEERLITVSHNANNIPAVGNCVVVLGMPYTVVEINHIYEECEVDRLYEVHTKVGGYEMPICNSHVIEIVMEEYECKT